MVDAVAPSALPRSTIAPCEPRCARLHSKYDSAELTKPALAAVWQRYLNQVDPNRVLPEAERLKRAQHARAADMKKLALRSARVGAARKRRSTP
jgi:hypothetical protein